MEIKNKNGVFLLLGSNEGNCLELIGRASEEIEDTIGEILKKSSIYKTEPWGFEAENYFLNQVLFCITAKSAEEILNDIYKIENFLGRKRTKVGYESRTIDIDILFFNDEIFNSETLTIPHPLIAERLFTLIPLNEIASDYIHPVLKKKIKTILENCNEKSVVLKFDCNKK